jgi:hypothetical protein
MKLQERKKLIENVAQLRRAERDTKNLDVAAVREDLEEQLGGTIARSMAAELMGVSHTALNNWIAAGDVPVVISERGRKEIPLLAFFELYERVSEEREAGRRKLHFLEPIMLEPRRRAARMHAGRGLDDTHRSVGHRSAELRGLVYHRALAPRLRRPMIEEARRKLARWKRDGRIDRRYAEAWEDVFSMPMSEIRKIIAADDERGRDLRQSSPLAGLLSEPERRKILETV